MEARGSKSSMVATMLVGFVMDGGGAEAEDEDDDGPEWTPPRWYSFRWEEFWYI